MEIANQWAGVANLKAQTRFATGSDKRDIVRLLRASRYSHVHLDWRPPIDWLEQGGFVVFTQQPTNAHSLAVKLWGVPAEVQACLAVGADPPPAAWVRVACLPHNSQTKQALAAMLHEGMEMLRTTAVTHLGWLATEPWPNDWLPQLGFTQSYEIETYYKEDLDTPNLKPPRELHIRRAHPDDMEQLAAIEVAAFAPLWRHSSDGLRLVQRQVISFDVAEWDGRLVGFQFSSLSGPNAHLARITVSPTMQGAGVGSALLAHTLREYQKHNVRYVSLNTQTDNYPSQALYQKFGFYATGQRLPVWVKYLE